jgi:hypothetical protein
MEEIKPEDVHERTKIDMNESCPLEVPFLGLTGRSHSRLGLWFYRNVPSSFWYDDARIP